MMPSKKPLRLAVLTLCLLTALSGCAKAGPEDAAPPPETPSPTAVPSFSGSEPVIFYEQTSPDFHSSGYDDNYLIMPGGGISKKEHVYFQHLSADRQYLYHLTYDDDLVVTKDGLESLIASGVHMAGYWIQNDVILYTERIIADPHAVYTQHYRYIYGDGQSLLLGKNLDAHRASLSENGHLLFFDKSDGTLYLLPKDQDVPRAIASVKGDVYVKPLSVNADATMCFWTDASSPGESTLYVWDGITQKAEALASVPVSRPMGVQNDNDYSVFFVGDEAVAYHRFSNELFVKKAGAPAAGVRLPGNSALRGHVFTDKGRLDKDPTHTALPPYIYCITEDASQQTLHCVDTRSLEVYTLLKHLSRLEILNGTVYYTDIYGTLHSATLSGPRLEDVAALSEDVKYTFCRTLDGQHVFFIRHGGGAYADLYCAPKGGAGVWIASDVSSWLGQGIDNKTLFFFRHVQQPSETKKMQTGTLMRYTLGDDGPTHIADNVLVSIPSVGYHDPHLSQWGISTIDPSFFPFFIYKGWSEEAHSLVCDLMYYDG
ncbi:MAG: hypothetical protein ACOX88_09535, partial [Christensenellales bacterium]